MIGTLISNKYEIKSTLAESHMYDVFSALEIETGATVVVKIMKPEMALNQERVRIFSEEIKSFASLSHGSIVHILDVDMHGGLPYAVTEMVEGKDLRAWMKETKVAFPEAVKTVQGIGLVLQYACERRVSIRSLKLSNILRTPRGEIRILSFSLPRLKLAGAPEPDETVGIQSDLFFLGTTFYELLCGESPIRKRGGINECWDSKFRQSLRIRHANLVPEMIDLLVEFIDKTLTREVCNRFPTHESFLLNLAELMHLSGGADAIEKTAAKLRLSTASEVVDAIAGRMEAFSEIAQAVVGGGPALGGPAVRRNPTSGPSKAPSASAPRPVPESADPPSSQGSPAGAPILRLIHGGRKAAESIIWRHSDDHPWFRNPLFLMGGGILLLIALIVFW